MRIDAHQHFWAIGQNDCTWPTPEQPLYRDYLPEHLQPILARERINGTILVPSQASIRETEFHLGLANRYAFIKGVVGWVDMKASNAVAGIKRLAAHPKLCGLQSMLQNHVEEDWFDDPLLDPVIDQMRHNGLRFDALVFSRHLPALHTFALRHPTLAIAIDHAGKPPIAKHELSPWQENISALAALPNVYCKLCGLVTEAGGGWEPWELQPYVDHLLQAFGAKRLMWGSDWPVVNLASDFGDWLGVAAMLVERLSEADRIHLFGETARRFYGLD